MKSRGRDSALQAARTAAGKTLAELALRPRTGASIIALTRGGVTESNPSDKTKLLAGDIVVLLGSRDEIRRAMEFILTDNADR